jgi:RimJ/RimL family protein N-acetyltransferase
MLHGLLVDLVPFTQEYYTEKMHVYWNNISRMWATMGDAYPTTHAQIKHMAERRAEGRERGYTGVHFMMRARNGNIIGTMGLGWVDLWNRIAWIGAWIGEEDYWGGGHGADGILLLVEYAFDWLDLHYLAATTMDLNVRVKRLAERCGFKLEARNRQATRVDGAWIDTLQYGLLRDEWRGRAELIDVLGLREKACQRYGDVD